MSWQDFLRIGLWGFMDNLAVMQPPPKMQIGFGWRSLKPAQVQRQHMVLQFCGANSVAQTMVQEANKETWLNHSEHPHTIDWGTRRVDLDFLEVKMKTRLAYMEMTPTWRFHHSHFPKQMVLWTHTGQAH